MALSISIAFLTVLVTVILFVVESRRRDRAARLDSRRAMVADALSIMERSVRGLARPALLRWSRGPDFEFSLAVPRLLLALDKDQHAVGAWLVQQTQKMQTASSDKATAVIGIQTAVKLTEWHQGEVTLTWFSDQLRLPSHQASKPQRLLARLRRYSHRLGESFIEGATIGAGLALLEPVLGSVRRH